jgi:4a-hydroxytetrahydrobiopterin dehydratase
MYIRDPDNRDVMLIEQLSKPVKRCVPCRQGTPKLSQEAVAEALTKVEGWHQEATTIKKTFTFTHFADSMTFVNKVAKIAEREGHHPDMQIFAYNQVSLLLTTHAVGGLTENDFIMASLINELA